MSITSSSHRQRFLPIDLSRHDNRSDSRAKSSMTTRRPSVTESIGLDRVSGTSVNTVDLDSGNLVGAVFQGKATSAYNATGYATQTQQRLVGDGTDGFLSGKQSGMHLHSGDSSETIPDPRDYSSVAESNETADTNATSLHTLPALQTKFSEADLNPVSAEDDPASYDLVAPPLANEKHGSSFSLEARGEDIFSREHLQEIFRDPILLLKFTTFLGAHRPNSVPTLIYYLDALKALKAVNYANAIAEALDPLTGVDFTTEVPARTRNLMLEEKAYRAFDLLVQEDLPAYVTYCYIHVVSVSIRRRITGTMPPHLREASEGLAEVFCLSDPSRPDNPIVFSSEGTIVVVLVLHSY